MGYDESVGATPSQPTRSTPPSSMGSSSSSGRSGQRGRSEHDEELDARRQAVARALTIGAPVWLAFFPVDVFVVALLGADASIGWFALWRAGVAAVMVVATGAAARARTMAASIAAEMTAFGAAAFGVAVLATRYGGLDSYYIQGMSIVIMYHAAAVPDRLGRGVALSISLAAIYPLVMAAASLFHPEIAAQWHGRPLWIFVQNFMFVFTTAILAPIGSYFVWAARRQVFEARKLGRYRLKARIGVGGSGEVWLADDERARREVALKILDRQAAQRPGARARFEREAKAAMSLHDPHTIRVFDWGASDDGVCFIAMELLDGTDLATQVRLHGRIVPARAVHFARQACASLVEAHAAGILHRDIKPENLFAARIGDEVDVVKLLDFGLAKVVMPDEDVTLTHGAFVGGTPRYMAPEVCAGRDADARSDLYSLGATLYFLVTGTPPFSGDSTGALFDQHLRQEPEPPSRRAPVPAALEEVILRCLAKDPAQRFASAAELDRALEACASGWSQKDARVFWSMRGMPVVS